MKCWICGKEVSKEELRIHLAEHLGVDLHDGKIKENLSPEKPEILLSKLPTVTALPEFSPNNTHPQETLTPKSQPEPLPLAKKKYLSGSEIIALLQNTNKQFPPKEVGECPLTK